MTTTRYKTASGSIYDVRRMGPGNPIHVRRQKLGIRHTERGAEQVAKRHKDGIDGEWRRANIVHCYGVGHSLLIEFGENDKLVTNAVTEINENPE